LVGLVGFADLAGLVRSEGLVGLPSRVDGTIFADTRKRTLSTRGVLLPPLRSGNKIV
jgi:hypothetical protein